MLATEKEKWNLSHLKYCVYIQHLHFILVAKQYFANVFLNDCILWLFLLKYAQNSVSFMMNALLPPWEHRFMHVVNIKNTKQYLPSPTKCWFEKHGVIICHKDQDLLLLWNNPFIKMWICCSTRHRSVLLCQITAAHLTSLVCIKRFCQAFEHIWQPYCPMMHSSTEID